MTIAAAGLCLDVTAEDYHADPAPKPSLSASIARTLLDETPRHAWEKHPRLNPGASPEGTRRTDLGSAAHALLLGRGRKLHVIGAEGYRTKAAREERDEARASGLTPILASDLDKAEAMVSAACRQIAAIPELAGVFEDGHSEAVAVWREGETWCRCMVDRLARAGFGGIALDYKTTNDTAHPAAAARRLLGAGADVQVAFYRRGIAAVAPRFLPLRFVFLCQETEPPFLLSALELDVAAESLGADKVVAALEVWRGCLASGQWPGFPQRICTVELPAWHLQAWMNRQLVRVASGEIGPRELVGPV